MSVSNDDMHCGAAGSALLGSCARWFRKEQTASLSGAVARDDESGISRRVLKGFAQELEHVSCRCVIPTERAARQVAPTSIRPGIRVRRLLVHMYTDFCTYLAESKRLVYVTNKY